MGVIEQFRTQNVFEQATIIGSYFALSIEQHN